MSAAGWKSSSLGEIADLHQGVGFPKRLQGRSKGDFGFYKVSDISRAIAAGNEVLGPATHCISAGEARALRATALPGNSIVFARIGEAIRLNRRALLPCPALVDNNVIGVKARAGIEDRYLYHFLKTVKLGELSQATTVPAVRTSDIAAIRVPIAPSDEQSRIVSKIDELFSDIEEGERALARVQKLVERYRQSVLKAAVTGELTREWREQRKGKLESGADLLARILKARRAAWEQSELDKMKAKGIQPADDKWKQNYQEPAAPDISDLPELPRGWTWTTMEQLCSAFANGLSQKPANEPPGHPILRISAVRARSVNSEDIRYYATQPGESVRGFVVTRGDLLFTRYNGSKELVGVSGVYKGFQSVLHPDKLIRARVAAHELINTDFLAICLNSGESWRHISSWVKTSAGQHGIAGSDIKRTPVPLAPIDEQMRIADQVETTSTRCDECATACREQLLRSQNLRQVTLRSAFAGDLVAQDPTDEPASVLLERIAAERALSAAAPKPSRKSKSRKTVNHG